MSESKRSPQKGSRSGPKPEILTIEADWKAAVSRVLAKGKPPKAAKKKRAQ